MAEKKARPRSEVLAKARQRLGLESLPGSQDRDGLISLTQLLYPNLDIKDPRYVAWQYDENPNGRAYERIGRVNQKVVGQYTTLPARYKLADQTVKGSLSVNTMTHPDYRGQGLFMLLAEEVFEACKADDAKVTLGFPNTNSYKGFLKHLDFKDIGSLPLWIQPLNLPELAQSEKTHMFFPLFQKADPLWRFLLKLRGLHKKSHYAIQEVASLSKEMDTFWDEVRVGYPNLTVRDERYLTWRFLHHPTRRYNFLTASSGNALKGYIVTRQTTVQGIACGMIVDLLVPATSEGRSVAQDLIRSVTRGFLREGLALAGCLAPAQSVTAQALKRCGFIRCPERFLPQPFPVIVRWNTSDAPPAGVFDLSQWYLTMGDYDAV